MESLDDTDLMALVRAGQRETPLVLLFERHHFDKGSYPENLESLAPTYLPKAPVDVLEGQPLRYTTKGKQGFQLYSLGWNLTDEGGQPSPRSTDGTLNQEQGDWVWSR